MDKHDALIVVDVQNDFCPGGRLAVPDGDDVVDVINRAIEHAAQAGALIVASRDWHPRHHVSFESEGGPWPEHCVQDSEGAAFHADLRLPDDVIKVSKGVRFDKDQYSGFDDTGLGDFLREHDIERVWVAGLAQDVCVHATVMSAREEGFDVVLIENATRAIDEESGRKALAEMRDAGAVITEDAP
jgi:nicotinamidase/pyrazinamidase